MITEIAINNYKSTLKTTVPLTAFTVLIGENGAGKSNIFEALVLASAASVDKLDTEYLSARGVRLCSSGLTTSAFTTSTKNKSIGVTVKTESSFSKGKDRTHKFVLAHDDQSNNQWQLDPKSTKPQNLNQYITSLIKTNEGKSDKEIEVEITKFLSGIRNTVANLPKSKKNPNLYVMKVDNPQVSEVLDTALSNEGFSRFTVYSPNLEVLRNPLAIPTTSPIGPKGEGMLATLFTMFNNEPERYLEVTDSLKLFGWFSSILLPTKVKSEEKKSIPKLFIQDRFIQSSNILLDDSSVNEGFLYVLFYLTLFCSSKTPHIFGIENIDTALNPRLCEVLIKKLAALGEKYGKQAIISTHNPAVLDGLNLDDKTQSLLIVRRNPLGHTLAEKYSKPKNPNNNPVKLSELFLRGHIGALPKGI